MGSKRLKALAVRGSQEVPVYDVEMTKKTTREQIDLMKNDKNALETLDGFHKYGTSHVAERFAHLGNTPVKNWGGVGIFDMPDASGLSGDAAIANLESRAGCWRCPVACEGRLEEGKGEYKYPAGVRRVEYETQAAFGTMCLNNDTESINMLNHQCNCYGLDTISAGSVIAFAMECYEKRIITKDDTDGIELTWGNHHAIVDMIEKMAFREGFGGILADGSKVAADRIGKGAEKYAVHIGGQELGMHDPKFYNYPGSTAFARFQMDPTPGRHTQEAFGPSSFPYHLINATGSCLFSDLVGGQADGEVATRYMLAFMKTVTGRDLSRDELFKCGERILNIRHAFNLREGINPLKLTVHPRIPGIPPLKRGPLKGITVDTESQIQRELKELDWDFVTTKPSREKLLELGLDDIAEELWT
jgi:aldehyde:ferredoxin oxidoreductase